MQSMPLVHSNTIKLFLAAVFMSLFSSLTFASALVIKQDDPKTMVLDLSNTVITQLNQNREALEGNPAKIKEFALAYVLPYIDTDKMARYVMGKHWRSANDQQQTQFVDAFTNTLIRSYSQSLLKLNIDSVDIKNAQEEKPGRATVASSVLQSDGNRSEVVYRLYLNKKTHKWMLYDISVEGISMLLSYRKAYDSDISKKGLNAVITEMQSKNAEFNGKA
ncbi:ABC transporter substrate-binding protein [Thiomicrorhabdus hydrogeniphila]